MLTTNVSIRSTIREVLAQPGSANPHDRIDEVLERVDESEYREYLRDAIRCLIPSLASEVSRTGFNRAISGVREALSSTPRTQIEVDPLTLEEKRVQHPAYSAKRALIRQEWEKFLDSSLSIGGGEWKRWGDVTVADLRTAAEKRTALAEAFTTEAGKYTRTADLLCDRGVETVGELAEEDLRTIQREIEA